MPYYIILISIILLILIQLTTVNCTIPGGWTEVSTSDEKLRDCAVFAAGSGHTIRTVLSGAKQVI